ncbi:hypothetical protein [Angustibacter luteus]|uniref:hypothetical protein n=1 Tax=Angustibacter luteus TaxID=658456 RepID=UPI0031ECB55D
MAGVGLATAVMLIVAAAWWTTHPKAFLDSPNYEAAAALPTEGMHAIAFAVIDPGVGRHGTVTFRQITANVVQNDAGAGVHLSVCRLDPERLDGSVIGAIDVADLSDYCRTLEPVRGATFDLDAASARQSQIVLTITPTRPGVVKVNGVRVSYRQGLRFGEQTTGPHLTVTSNEPGSR